MKKTGNLQSRLILALIFFIMVTPFALAVRALSDPLRIKTKGDKSYWLAKPSDKLDSDYFKRQF